MAADDQKQTITDIALRSYEIAKFHKHHILSIDHILAALLEYDEVVDFLSAMNMRQEYFTRNLNLYFESDALGISEDKPSRSYTYEIVLAMAIGATVVTSGSYNPVYMLLNLTQLKECQEFSFNLLKNASITEKVIKNYLYPPKDKAAAPSVVAPSDDEPQTVDEANAFIRKYCTNLNEQAREGKIDPIIGRENVIEKIVHTVSRRTKNNVILVGDPGVGKTAIAEGLAVKISKNETPKIIADHTVWSLNVAGLVAGTRFRGDFEERMKVLLNCFDIVGKTILYIDEIHTIMDAGTGAKGSLDVANLLKPALAKGKLRCIGSTTAEEYRRHFEKDMALVRRFKKTSVEEPSVEDAKKILMGLKPIYEKYHGVEFTDEAVEATVELTAKYIPNSRLPDKAIDILDTVGARWKIASEGGDKKLIEYADVEAEVSAVSSIPVQTRTDSENERLMNLDEKLKSGVFGQDHAIEALVNAIYVSKAGLRAPNKPIGSFLFTGPTGVGKTETAKQLAKTLGIPLVRFNMSEYSEAHTISRLIGSPAGYVGHGDGAAGNGLLINEIDSKPSCVLLLDEFEKANNSIYNLLLQVMDDGSLDSASGKKINFRNVILIMTSNAGVAETEKKPLGFGRQATTPDIDDRVLQKMFAPEFRNRLDGIISFKRLEMSQMGPIVTKFIDETRAYAAERNVTIEIDDAAVQWLGDKGFDPTKGARPLSRVIDEHIKKKLSLMMLFGELKNGGVARISLSDGVIDISTN